VSLGLYVVRSEQVGECVRDGAGEQRDGAQETPLTGEPTGFLAHGVRVGV
jgi:hypothetical protein